MTPSVSVLTGFDCLDFQDFASGGGEGYQPATVVPVTVCAILWCSVNTYTARCGSK